MAETMQAAALVSAVVIFAVYTSTKAGQDALLNQSPVLFLTPLEWICCSLVGLAIAPFIASCFDDDAACRRRRHWLKHTFSFFAFVIFSSILKLMPHSGPAGAAAAGMIVYLLSLITSALVGCLRRH